MQLLMRIRPFTRFIEHLFLAWNGIGHGVHSPFFFEIINTLHRNKSNSALVYKEAEAWRSKLLHDTRRVWVDDFGTGTSSFRKICDIASVSAVDRKYGLLLAYFASRAGTREIIEFGTSLGIGTLYMATGNREAKIITVEGSRAVSEVAAEGFSGAAILNIESISGTFDENLEELCRKYTCPGLVFIDGNHKGSALKRYFDAFAGVAGDETVIIADDIDYSYDMSKTWDELKADRRVTGSIDTGRMGILFFTPREVALNYRIRY